jgi:hypothetical protein
MMVQDGQLELGTEEPSGKKVAVKPDESRERRMGRHSQTPRPQAFHRNG